MTTETNGLRAAALDLMRRSAASGILYCDLATAFGCEDRRASNALYNMESAGICVSRREPGTKRTKRYFLPDLAPAGQTARTVRPPPGQSKAAVRAAGAPRLDPAAPAIVPAGVRVIVCPSTTDNRFTFHPPPGWRGEITKDWRAARLERQG